jgi:hypothetical protein
MNKLIFITLALFLIFSVGNGQSNLSRVVLGTGNFGTDPYPTADIVGQNDEYISNYADGTWDFGTADIAIAGATEVDITATNADGIKPIAVYVTQSTSVALTGTLKGIYARATAGSAGGTGTIRGCEIIARLNDAVTSAVASVVTGGYFSADAKNKTATTLRGLEVELAGGGSGTSTLAEGIVVFNNSSSVQTTSVGLDINGGTVSGHKVFTNDIRLQYGETITNDVNGTIKMNGAVNFAAAGGTYAASVGILGGAGASGTSTAYDLGSTAGNNKGLSFYLKSSSTLASDVIEGLYVNTYHGINATSPAPSGEAARFRAYLIGDQAGTVALTGMHCTVEASSGASGAGLVVGGRSNIVYPDAAINLGTSAGFQAELYSGGTTTSFGGGVPSILRLCIDGTITDATWGVVPVFDLSVPATMVSTNSYIVDTNAGAEECDAKMRIRINGVYYWVMLSVANN